MQDYTDTFNLSEAESLSDSDWLDIASNRESDDNESVCSSRDTDHDELEYRQSRRSSTSFGSSRDGEIDAWEGFVEDSADEVYSDDVRVPSPTQPHTTIDGTAHTESAMQEEQRVKEGLDQSMISTLSSSRSSSLHSSTVHTSSRDLRLSFPDPIRTSLNDLANTSYEDIPSPSEEALSKAADADVPTAPSQPVDPGPSLTPEVPAVECIADEVPTSSLIESNLNISLYGFSTASKWTVVDTILEKLAVGACVSIKLSHEDSNGTIKQFCVTKPEYKRTFPDVITVVDRTLNIDNTEYIFADQPSLAVVYLPKASPAMLAHTYYLPIVPSPSILDTYGSDADLYRSSQQIWDALNIPQSKIFPIMEGIQSCVLKEETVTQLPPPQVCRAFERLVARGKRNKNLKELNHPAPVITLLTLVSLVLGVVVSSTLPSSTPVVAPTPAASTTSGSSVSASIMDLLRPVINDSHQGVPKAEITSAVISSSLKDFALSVFHPVPTSSSPNYCTGPMRECGCSRPPTWGERFKSSTDVILRPIPSVLSFDTGSKALSIMTKTSHFVRQPAHVTPTSSPSDLSTSSFALGLGLTLPTSLSQAVNLYVPPLLAVVRNDVQDLLDALDELMRALSHQADFIVAQTTALIQKTSIYAEKGTNHLNTAKENLYRRHGQAQKRAKEMKEKGAKWLTAHTELAKGKAKEIAEGWGVDSWGPQWFAKEKTTQEEEGGEDWISLWFGKEEQGRKEVLEGEGRKTKWFGKEHDVKRHANMGRASKSVNRLCRESKLGRLSRVHKRNGQFYS